MHLLIIDDTAEFLELLQLLLPEVIGTFTSKTAVSGNAAIRLLAEDSSYNLIISDYWMNDGNGDAVFRYVQKSGLSIPFILFSSFLPEDMGAFTGMPFAGAVVKHDLSTLRHLVKSALFGDLVTQR